MKRVLKIVAIVVGILLLVAIAAASWFLTRPPKPTKIYDPGPSGRRINDAGLFANYFPATGVGRKPGILLLGGSEGGLARDLVRQALLLQRDGFNVLHVAYHNAPGKPASLTNVPLEEFSRGLDWLNRDRKSIRGRSASSDIPKVRRRRCSSPPAIPVSMRSWRACRPASFGMDWTRPASSSD